MRRVRYGVAMSLDGYIADSKDEANWIVMDPDIDFGEMFARFDAFLMGRRTYEMMQSQGAGQTAGMTTVVFSRTMRPEDFPAVRIVSDNDWRSAVDELKALPGKDIWLFGGGQLFQTMLDADYVDGVDVAIIPVILGGGVPFLPPPARTAKLRLTSHRIYEKTGTVMLSYDVVKA